MAVKPIWQLVQDCARELTRAGKIPFTRRDLIDCVRKGHPSCNEGSINPVIQGLTNNLRGGAPVADGKNILHSVERGRFVLYSNKDQFVAAEATQTLQTEVDEGLSPKTSELPFPETETKLRDAILDLLRPELRDREDIGCVAEGNVSYTLPDGVVLRHASDILVTSATSKKRVSIEIKYKSAVTDQFKCRAYDALHMKNAHGKDLLTILLFVKSRSGVSIAQAERISYPFDQFIGVHAAEADLTEIAFRLAREITSFL